MVLLSQLPMSVSAMDVWYHLGASLNFGGVGLQSVRGRASDTQQLPDADKKEWSRLLAASKPLLSGSPHMAFGPNTLWDHLSVHI